MSKKAPQKSNGHEQGAAGHEGNGSGSSKGAQTDRAGWPAVDPTFLTAATSPAPSFPIEALPSRIQELIKGFSAARELPVDYVAGSFFAGCAGAIGNRARILTFDGGHEPLTNFVALVGPPSSGKSQAITIMERCLLALDNELQAAHQAIVKDVAPASLEQFDRKLRETVARRLAFEVASLSEKDDDGAAKEHSAPALVLSEWTGAGLLDELRTGIEGRMLIAHELVGALVGRFSQIEGYRFLSLIRASLVVKCQSDLV